MRDGTDYGFEEQSLDDRVALLMKQFRDGSARLVFETTTETIGIVTKRSLHG